MRGGDGGNGSTVPMKRDGQVMQFGKIGNATKFVHASAEKHIGMKDVARLVVKRKRRTCSAMNISPTQMGTRHLARTWAQESGLVIGVGILQPQQIQVGQGFPPHGWRPAHCIACDSRRRPRNPCPPFPHCIQPLRDAVDLAPGKATRFQTSVTHSGAMKSISNFIWVKPSAAVSSPWSTRTPTSVTSSGELRSR